MGSMAIAIDDRLLLLASTLVVEEPGYKELLATETLITKVFSSYLIGPVVCVVW